MTTKTITIMNDAYTLLAKSRMGNESFSEIIRRVLSKKRNISEFAGAWSDMNEEEATELKENIKKIRRGLHQGLMKRVTLYESS